jgi:hypothetical protein
MESGYRVSLDCENFRLKQISDNFYVEGTLLLDWWR